MDVPSESSKGVLLRVGGWRRGGAGKVVEKRGSVLRPPGGEGCRFRVPPLESP